MNARAPGSFVGRFWANRDWKVGTKLILLTVPLIAVASMTAAAIEHARNTENLREKLTSRAKSVAHQIMADRQYYASVVVPRAKDMGASFGMDYREVHGRFPLPATFVREVSEAMARVRNGYTANLISPWAINKDKGLKDRFQTDAFAYLAQHPGEAEFIRTDTVEGRAVLRVLMADVASAQSCVTCHNGHPDSPKRDFKLNDLMGGLEITIPMDQYLQDSRRELAMTLAGGGVMCLLVLAIVAFGSRRTVTQPLAKLAGDMERFVGERPYRPGQIPALTGDEVVHIAGAFEQMKAVIGSQQKELKDANLLLEQRVIERTEELRRTMEEKERIGSELRIASDIQKSILPRTFPAFPDRSDFELYAETIPAREMGGDFYDFFLLDQDRVGLVIADVSGKGVPAAIFMAVTRTMLKATAMQGGSPGDCLRHVNDLLVPDNDAAMFVTVFYGILDTRDGSLAYSNAGHNIPYVLSAKGGIALLENPDGMALGVLEDNVYRVKRAQLEPGDGLFLYTDGVTEAMDGAGRLFSTERLEALLRRIQQGSSTEIVQDTVAEVRHYAAGEPQADDITLLALRYLQRPVTSTGETQGKMEIRLLNQLSELERAGQAVESFALAHGLPDQVLQAVTLGVDEVVTNIISYAYDDQAEHQIMLRLALHDGELTAEVEDDGRPFNPLETPPPDLDKPIEERPIGGLGIHLLKKLMDSVIYRREEGRNLLIMRKAVTV